MSFDIIQNRLFLGLTLRILNDVVRERNDVRGHLGLIYLDSGPCVIIGSCVSLNLWENLNGFWGRAQVEGGRSEEVEEVDGPVLPRERCRCLNISKAGRQTHCHALSTLKKLCWTRESGNICA
jgi:hypothetical protein